MVNKKIGRLDMLFFKNLLRHRKIKHFVSTRTGGISKPPYNSLNLGFHVGDNPEDVLNNRKRLSSALKIPLNQFTTAGQIHSDKVSIISEGSRGKGGTNHKDAIDGADAMVTNVADICLIVLVADCVPILFFDPQKEVVGIAHAGWRGTLKCIAKNTVRTMETAFGSLTKDIIVGIGPSIGPCCYKVGPEVISQVRGVFHAANEYIVNESGDGTGYLDLQKANLKQLLHAGIEKKNIETASICTCHNPDLFFSYRHQKGYTGRFGAGIFLC
ncbi:MAG TPA: peptidoglycan editing factor PgeF [Desulfatiglandales bacterium]|nr:peptidoglycan editing factor PgeF [Desulfatiglandales bacterium]